MLRAVGLAEEDFAKPQVGLVSAGNEVTPCNLSGPRLAELAKEGVRSHGGVGLTFATIAVSDGISMGHEGMRASLVSREVIADSVELVMHAERFDAMVTIAGCDKSLPGMLMAAARLDLPAVFLYGGSSLPGRWQDARHLAGRCVRGDRRLLRRTHRASRICSGSSSTPVPAPAPAPGCSPPTPWRRSARHWGCRSQGAPRSRRSTRGSSGMRWTPVRRSCVCSTTRSAPAGS